MIDESAKENLVLYQRYNNDFSYSDNLISPTKNYKSSIRDTDDNLIVDFAISVTDGNLIMQMPSFVVEQKLIVGKNYVYDLRESVGGVDNRLKYGNIVVKKGITAANSGGVS